MSINSMGTSAEMSRSGLSMPRRNPSVISDMVVVVVVVVVVSEDDDAEEETQKEKEKKFLCFVSFALIDRLIVSSIAC